VKSSSLIIQTIIVFRVLLYLHIFIKRVLVHDEVRSKKIHESGIEGLAKEGSSLRNVEKLA
jgi:hypothetical protein